MRLASGWIQVHAPSCHLLNKDYETLRKKARNTVAHLLISKDLELASH